MSRSRDEKDQDQIQLPRRKFLQIGSLGVAALAAGAAGHAAAGHGKDAPDTGTPGQGAQTPPAQGAPPQTPAGRGQTPQAPRTSQFKRNFDPVPPSEPSMNFAAFTDTHVGQ